MLGEQMFMIVTSSCEIDLLIIMYQPSLSLVTVFILMSILPDMSNAVPTFF